MSYKQKITSSLIVLAVVVAFIGFRYASSGSDFNQSAYDWSDDIDKQQAIADIQNADSWQQVTMSRYKGFYPESDTITEVSFAIKSLGPSRSESMKNNDCDSEALRVKTQTFGYGVEETGYCLIVKTDNESMTITSANQLRSVFTPVDNFKEAVSFLAATKDVFSQKDLQASVAETDGGYLIRAERDVSHCAARETIFRVSRGGVVKLLATKKPESNEPCRLPV